MKNILLLPIFLLTSLVAAQYTISGTFSPAEDYTWLIAYHLKPGTQIYVADTAIKDGKFEMKIPENSPKGVYRLVYAVPQEEFNFDIIYNGKENLKLTFTTEEGPLFAASQENILFSTYFREIHTAELDLISYYAEDANDMEEFKKITDDYRVIQNSFMEKSKGLLVERFINANAPYIPVRHETINQYVQNRKKHYFDALDISDSVLQASSFLTDKLGNYVFTALPLKEMTTDQTEKAMQENVKTVVEKLGHVSDKYRFSTLYSIWTRASAASFNKFADLVYHNYLKPNANSPENQKVMAEIELHNRLRLGATAPEITWKDGSDHQSLSKLEGSENYVLVFWSSTCGHCLRELPALHKRLKANTHTKVIAVGLEDDNSIWKVESAKLQAFEHAIALGKWDSEYAHLYGIDSTPTYFILDKDKRIIAKPENDSAVVDFLEKN